MLQPGTLTSTSRGRVRVSSAVCAIASPPGSPPERHYTQVRRALPPQHARHRPSPPPDIPLRTLVSPPPCPCWRPAPARPPLLPQRPCTGGPATRETPSGRYPSPPFPRVWPHPWRVCRISKQGPRSFPGGRSKPLLRRVPPGTRAPLLHPPLRHGPRSSSPPRDAPRTLPRRRVLPERPLRAAPQTRDPPRTAARARRFPSRVPPRVLAR